MNLNTRIKVYFYTLDCVMIFPKKSKYFRPAATPFTCLGIILPPAAHTCELYPCVLTPACARTPSDKTSRFNTANPAPSSRAGDMLKSFPFYVTRRQKDNDAERRKRNHMCSAEIAVIYSLDKEFMIKFP